MRLTLVSFTFSTPALKSDIKLKQLMLSLSGKYPPSTALLDFQICVSGLTPPIIIVISTHLKRQILRWQASPFCLNHSFLDWHNRSTAVDEVPSHMTSFRPNEPVLIIHYARVNLQAYQSLATRWVKTELVLPCSHGVHKRWNDPESAAVLCPPPPTSHMGALRERYSHLYVQAH